MPYTQPNLAQAQLDLASRLNDPGFVHWVQDECTVYIREAIRTWQAWTSHFRDQASFGTTLGEPFYHLPTVIPSLRGYTVTNWELITALQYSLIEPAAPGGTWTGTDQFTLDQLSIAVQRRRDQFLRETGSVLTRSVTNYAAPPTNGRLALSEAVVNVRRAAWRTTTTGLLYPLLVSDEWAGAHYAPFWNASSSALNDPPLAYSVSTIPPLTLQLMPPPIGAGDLDLVSINIGAALDSAVEAVLGIPDDFAWVVKYGALADLLSGDGLALDSQRAAYCELRWQQGIEQARSAAIVLNAFLDDTGQSPPAGRAIAIGSLSEADRFSPTWQLVPDEPNTLLLAGQSLIALLPPPGAFGGPWTVTLDVVRNAPVPAINTDILQVSQDVYDTVLDIAQHTALFKEGVGQLQQAEALLDRAARAAGIDLRLQQASQPTRTGLTQQQSRDRQQTAEQRAPILQGVEAD